MGNLNSSAETQAPEFSQNHSYLEFFSQSSFLSNLNSLEIPVPREDILPKPNQFIELPCWLLSTTGFFS